MEEAGEDLPLENALYTHPYDTHLALFAFYDGLLPFAHYPSFLSSLFVGIIGNLTIALPIRVPVMLTFHPFLTFALIFSFI